MRAFGLLAATIVRAITQASRSFTASWAKCVGTDEQLRAAIAAAPYLHPRLATTTLNATVASPVKPPLDPEKLPPHLRGPLEEIMLWCDAQHRSGARQGSD
jgi:hypothetical protein